MSTVIVGYLAVKASMTGLSNASLRPLYTTKRVLLVLLGVVLPQLTNSTIISIEMITRFMVILIFNSIQVLPHLSTIPKNWYFYNLKP
jgi:hypothetical protein